MSYNGHSIFVKNVTVAELDAAQFVFTGGAAAEKPIIADDDSFDYVGKALVSDDSIDYDGFASGADLLAEFLAIAQSSAYDFGGAGGLYPLDLGGNWDRGADSSYFTDSYSIA